MLGTMLVGAWLLIQQQCCSVYGDSSSRFRSAALVDPLMRRSPLEKNFMRFGRSSPSTFSRDVRLKENFMRFGRATLDTIPTFEDFSKERNVEPFVKQSEESSDPIGDKSNDGFKESGVSRLRRAKENFMRFGRKDGDKDIDSSEDGKAKRTSKFMRFGRDKEEAKDLMDRADSSASSFFDDPEFLRAVRAKENFMRFGRDKERVVRNEKGKQDSFIRFGKSEGLNEDEYDDCEDSMDRRQSRGGDTGFVRFGRGKDNFMRFGKRKEEEEPTPMTENKDKTILIRVARDQDSFLRQARQTQQDKNGFIRFGRNDRMKRDIHKHKESFHHFTNGKNSHHDQDGGVCKTSFLENKNSNDKDAECKDESCKPLYLPWPFYYQPSLYSVLPNVLASPQVSMPPTPQLIHKPKRSRTNNFIRLG